jgi:hypothetical protein
MLVEESDTFCSRLEAALTDYLGSEALVANSAVIGYSTEQEYYTLLELAPQIKPHVVVVCFYANDVDQDHHAVLNRRHAAGDWKSARLWLERCADYARKHAIRFAVLAVPDRIQISSRASRRFYQHRLEGITSELSIYLIDPSERFLAHRRQPLWLEGDAHFAPAGHALLAQVLFEHLIPWLPIEPADDQSREVATN